MNSSRVYRYLAKLYDLLDVTYFRRKAGNPRNTVNDYIEDKNIRILELCTGTAANAIAIAKQKRKAEIIGIDLSEDMLSIAAEKVKKAGLDKVKLYKMDATDMSFPKEAFDVVLISLVLHEIPAELSGKILMEAKRVLKPEGSLLVLEWEEPKTFLRRLLFTPIRKMEPKGFEAFLKMDMNSYFKKYGLEIKDRKACDYSKVLKLEKL